MKRQISLRVNGRSYEVEVEPRQSLLEVLRDDLRLTGTKEGCGSGDCGTCTVLLDGQPITSCLLLAVKAQGKEITTIEGLSADGLDPMQKAFVERGAVQCGFCTPGMILAAKALLAENPRPSEREVRGALAGNLCRCTGYTKVVEAVLAAADPQAVPERGEMALPRHDVVGKGIVRIDAADKVAGKSIYTADVMPSGMLYGKVLRSPHPHARLKSIDAAQAEQFPGVRAVITGKDFPACAPGREPVMVTDKVCYEGQAVAAVAADDRHTAEEAIRLIEVEYEVLPAVTDPLEAMKADAPVIHEWREPVKDGEGKELPPNVNGFSRSVVGDVEKAFAEADLIVEDTFITHTDHQGYLEPHAATASVDEVTGKVRLWATTQGQFNLRQEVAGVMGIPIGQLVVYGSVCGGGFGGKAPATVEPIAIRLAQKAGRPVQVVMSREEEFLATTPRTGIVQTLRTAVKKDGTLLAREIKGLGNGGAYGSHGVSDGLMTGPYRLPNLLIESYSVNTNTLTPGAFRAPGGPESAFAFDSQMDIIARKLGLDPLEIRLKNLVEEGDFVFGGEKLPRNAWREALCAAAEKARWGNKKGKPCHGSGIACGHWRGYAGLSNVVVSVHEDGGVRVLSGAIDITGSDTVFAQIAAEVLGVDVADVAVVFADTDTALPAEGTWGSRTIYTMGSAVKRAAEEARAQLLQAAASDLGVSEEDLETANGKVQAKGNPQRCRTIAEAVGWVQQTTGSIVGRASLTDLPLQPVLCAQVVDLHVDPATGQVTVDKITAAADVGFAINPVGVEGQIEGGAGMGMAYGLLEEYVYDKDGKMLNPSWLDFRQPTAVDIGKIQSIIVEAPTDTGPFGAKHIGEPPIMPTAAAIANAIEDAVGVRVKEIPITPERLLKAIKEQGRDTGG